MSPWIRRTTVAISFILGFLTLHVSAQQETIELLLKLAREEAVHYSQSTAWQFTVEGPTRAVVESRIEGRYALRVLDIDAAGTLLLEITDEELRVTTEGRVIEPTARPIVMRVRPDGTIVERVIVPEIIENVTLGSFSSLPGKPVRIGESWVQQDRISTAGLTMQATTTSTLVGVDRTNDGRAARIRVVVQATLSPGDFPAPAGTQISMSGTVRTNGETLWSIDRGRMLRLTGDMTINTQIELTAQGRTTRVQSNGRGTIRHELLPAGSVTIPPVPADMLIAPGKGIGPFTLEMPASEFTNRLGEPRPLPGDAGFRAPRGQWTNGLAGFNDPDDQTKIIGLYIGERAYRTDKGIRFGTSEGAVLLAYGMAPVRVNMTIPNLGGVRFLVYDDQGIAFAITSDAEHAGRGPAHAPIGAVDWITIFRPGGAGKIYPLP